MEWLLSSARRLAARARRGRQGLFRVAANTGWLTLERVLRITVALFVGLWVARYLGPERFGLLSFAEATVGLLAALAPLGLPGLVVRDLVKRPDDAPTSIGTAFGLQVGSYGVVLLIGAALWAWGGFAEPVGLMILLLAVGQLGRTSAPVEYWFESRIQARYIVIGKSVGLLVAAAVKVALILGAAAVWTFAGAAALDVLITGAAVVVVYHLTGQRARTWRFSGARARELLAESWPLMVSSAAVLVYMRIDQVMLQTMVGPHELGLYSAALKLSEVWYFVPVAVMSSVFPVVVRARERSPAEYRHKLSMAFALLGGIAVVVAAGVALVANPVMLLLYGPQYDGAGPMLALHVWAGVPVAMGVVANSYFLAEGYTRIALQRAVLGAVVNVVLNLFLVPALGGIGAALATIAAQASASMIGNVIDPRTRDIGMMQLRAMSPVSWVRAARDAVRSRGDQ